MGSSLENIEFLSRSSSRVKVLDALQEEPRTRDELKNETDASRTTLSRMLADFEDRGWITRSNGQYQPTPEGEFVASEVKRLLENMETAEKLDGALGWIPTDEFEFDLRRLQNAEISSVRWDDPASMRTFAEHFDGATRVRSTATTVTRDAVELLRNLTVEQDGSYEGILGPSAVESIREHPVLRKQLREILESGRASVYRYTGEDPPIMVMLVDELASVCNHGNGGLQMETVVSDDEAFRSWVEGYIDSAIADSEPLDIDTLVA
jgi:predicted transcriptional regulator